MTAPVPDAEAAARKPALDGVRGLAILSVMVFHFTALVGGQSGRLIDEVFLRISAAGWAGVDLFFVLSGFLITGILFDAKAAAVHYFRHFYARRTLRIFPAYYGFLLLLAILLPLVQPVEREVAAAIREKLVWYATYLTNVHLDGNPIGRKDFFFTSHLWSLAVEEQFYLVWPAVVLLFSRRSLMAICLLIIAGALGLRVWLDAAGADHYIAHEITPARMDSLAVGALIALAARDARDLHLLKRWMRPAAVAAATVVITLYFSRDRFSPYDVWVQTIGYTALAIVFGALVLLAIGVRPGTLANGFLSHGALTFFGRYSYALYLFHWPVAALLSRRSSAFDGVPLVAGSLLLREAAFIAAAGALVVSVAWLSWHLWEQQFLKLKARFPYGRALAPERLST